MSVAVQQQEMDNLPAEKIALLKRTICIGATDDELQLFLHACKRTKLDPFMRQIHAVRRDSRMTIQTGIDGYRLIAERTGKYMPGKKPVFTCKGNGDLISCITFCKKLDSLGQWHEVENEVFWEEYAAFKKDGGVQQMWATKPRIMLAKCCEATMLRKAFPADLSGVYTAEEMEQADNPKVLPIKEKLVEEVIQEEKIVVTITSEEAVFLENEMTAMGDDFRKNTMLHLGKKSPHKLETAYDFTHDQAKLVKIWIEKKRKTVEETQEIAF